MCRVSQNETDGAITAKTEAAPKTGHCGLLCGEDQRRLRHIATLGPTAVGATSRAKAEYSAGPGTNRTTKLGASTGHTLFRFTAILVRIAGSMRQ